MNLRDIHRTDLPAFLFSDKHMRLYSGDKRTPVTSAVRLNTHKYGMSLGSSSAENLFNFCETLPQILTCTGIVAVMINCPHHFRLAFVYLQTEFNQIFTVEL